MKPITITLTVEDPKILQDLANTHPDVICADVRAGLGLPVDVQGIAIRVRNPNYLPHTESTES